MSGYKQRSANNCSAIGVLRPIIIGVSTGAIVTLVVILLVSAVFAIVKSFADNLAVPLAVLAAAVGAFVGGFIAARIFCVRGLFVGLATGFLLFAIVWLISVICSSTLFTTAVLAQLICMLLGGASGGYCAVNARRKK